METDLDNNTLCEVLASEPVLYTIEPNPAGNQFYINFALPVASELTLRMVNSQGSVVYQNTMSMPKGYHSFFMDAQSFSNGLYFLQFSTTHVKKTQSVMIMK